MAKKDKIREFWKYNIHPITGWKPLKPPKKSEYIQYEIKEKDQASYFKPRGFH